MILELAVAAGRGYIGYSEYEGFTGSEERGVTALTPSDFLRLIRS